MFSNVSVPLNGTLWYAASSDNSVDTATSTDHGATWACSGPVSTTTAQAVMRWLVATAAGVDLVYDGMVNHGQPDQERVLRTEHIWIDQRMGNRSS